MESTKGRQTAQYQPMISWIAQWERRKLGCMQQIDTALKQQPCCEGDGFSLQQFDYKPQVCKWNRRRGNGGLHRLWAPVGFQDISAAVARLRLRLKWINRQKAADNYAESTGRAAACWLWIHHQFHAVLLVISKYMQLIWYRCKNSGFFWCCWLNLPAQPCVVSTVLFLFLNAQL